MHLNCFDLLMIFHQYSKGSVFIVWDYLTRPWIFSVYLFPSKATVWIDFVGLWLTQTVHTRSEWSDWIFEVFALWVASIFTTGLPLLRFLFITLYLWIDCWHLIRFVWTDWLFGFGWHVFFVEKWGFTGLIVNTLKIHFIWIDLMGSFFHRLITVQTNQFFSAQNVSFQL